MFALLYRHVVVVVHIAQQGTRLKQQQQVLRVCSDRASASVRLQRVGLSCFDAETGAHSANFTARCSSWGCCHARRRATTGAGERSVQAALVAFSGGGTAAEGRRQAALSAFLPVVGVMSPCTSVSGTAVHRHVVVDTHALFVNPLLKQQQ